jgi:hypothetical protein
MTIMTTEAETKVEKLTLLALAGVCVISLTYIAYAALHTERLDPNAATLIGVIVGGLIAFAKDIVAAIRSYASSAQLEKATTQLAASSPANDNRPTATMDAKEAANATAEAAQDRADAITADDEVQRHAV